MIFFSFILLSVLLVASSIHTQLVNARQVYFNEMAILLDKMELFVYLNDLQNNPEVLRYIYAYKYFIANTNFADIQVLAGLLMKSSTSLSFEVKKRRYRRLLLTIPSELYRLGVAYDKRLDKAIRLSFFKPAFIIYFLKRFPVILLNAVRYSNTNIIRRFFKNFKDVYKYENLLVQNNNPGSQSF